VVNSVVVASLGRATVPAARGGGGGGSVRPRTGGVVLLATVGLSSSVVVFDWRENVGILTSAPPSYG
jgi:hypothetical protein